MLLAEQVRTRLAVLDLQAAGVLRRPVDVQGVRTQLRGLIEVWRRRLEAHHPADGASRCPRCRRWWGGGRRWPCGVWRTAHTSLVTCQLPAEVPGPDAMAAAATWVRDASPARRSGSRAMPAPRHARPQRSIRVVASVEQNQSGS